MKKLLAVATTMSVLVGCGSSVCERERDIVEPKIQNCPLFASTVTDQAVEECEASLDGCTGDDIRELNLALDCVETLNSCVAGEELAFGFAMAGCFANREISQECGAN